MKAVFVSHFGTHDVSVSRTATLMHVMDKALERSPSVTLLLFLFTVQKLTHTRTHTHSLLLYNHAVDFSVSSQTKRFFVWPWASFLVSTVDDGTGVINCLCWKNDLLKEEGDPSKCKSAFVWVSMSCFTLCNKLRLLNHYTLTSKGKLTCVPMPANVGSLILTFLAFCLICQALMKKPVWAS